MDIFTAGLTLDEKTGKENRFGTKAKLGVIAIFAGNKKVAEAKVWLPNHGDGLEIQMFAMLGALNMSKEKGNTFYNSDKAVVGWFKTGRSVTRGEVEWQIGTDELIKKRADSKFEWIAGDQNPARKYLLRLYGVNKNAIQESDVEENPYDLFLDEPKIK